MSTSDLTNMFTSVLANMFTSDSSVQLVEGGGGGLPCPFLEKKKCPDFGKCALSLCIYGLNSHLKCCLKSTLEKNIKFFSLQALLLSAKHETFIEVPLLEETSPTPKNFCVSVTLPSCSPLTWPTCSPVTWPTCSPVTWSTCSLVSLVTWATCLPVPWPTC